MKKFYISDMHLFHEDVLKSSDRPYETIQDMHNDILIKWNKKVSRNDIVHIIGDVSSPKNQCDVKKVVDFLKLLNGNKILIIGNHDRESIKNYEFRKCFIEIKEYARKRDGNRNVILFHCPLESWEGQKKGYIHLHGHTHKDKISEIENRYNVGVDVRDFEPRTIDELVNN